MSNKRVTYENTRNSVASFEPVLELFKVNEKLNDFYKTTEFKKTLFETRRNNDNGNDTNMSSTHFDINLKEKLEEAINDEKDFQIVNTFLNLYDEKDNNNILDGGQNINVNNLQKRLLTNQKFSPGIFSEFDFIDKIKSIIINSLEKFENKNTIENNEKYLNLPNDIDNDFILDVCLNNNSIDYTKHYFYDNKNNFSSNESNDDEALISKDKAIFEYENQIMSYLSVYEIDKQSKINYIHEVDEKLDYDAYTFFKSMIIKEKNKNLKNKLKLILRTLNYVDPTSHIPILSNSIKNNILRSWKENYVQQLNSLILQKKKNLEEKKKLKENESFYNEIINMRSMNKQSFKKRISVDNVYKRKAYSPDPKKKRHLNKNTPINIEKRRKTLTVPEMNNNLTNISNKWYNSISTKKVRGIDSTFNSMKKK
jgi:hypothetical protein